MCQESSLDASESRSGLCFPSVERRCPEARLATCPYILAAFIDCMWRAVTLNSPALRAAPPVSALEGVAFRGAFQGCQTGVKVGYICVLVP